MTYIVDPKVVDETPVTETTKGQLIMGRHLGQTNWAAKFISAITEEKDGLKVQDEMLLETMQQIHNILKVISLHLALASDRMIEPSEVEDL